MLYRCRMSSSSSGAGVTVGIGTAGVVPVGIGAAMNGGAASAGAAGAVGVAGALGPGLGTSVPAWFARVDLAVPESDDPAAAGPEWAADPVVVGRVADRVVAAVVAVVAVAARTIRAVS
jgi:hypothetical protein